MQRVTADQADAIGSALRTADGARDSGAVSSGAVFSGAGSAGAGRMRRMMWSRALPGTIIVIAALTIPELSVGAGDFVGGQRRDERGALSLSAPVPDLPRIPTATSAPLSAMRDRPALNLSASLPRAEPATQTPLPLLPASEQGRGIAPASEPFGALTTAPSTGLRTQPVRAPADLSGLDTGSLLAASTPVEPAALAMIALPSAAVAEATGSSPPPLRPALPRPPEPAAAGLVADAPRVRPIFGGSSGSFSELLPPEKQAALQTLGAAVPPVAAVNPAMVTVGARGASAGVLDSPQAAAPAPAITAAAAAVAVAAPVPQPRPRPQLQPRQQLAPAPVRAAVSASASAAAAPPVAPRAPVPSSVRAAPVSAPLPAPVPAPAAKLALLPLARPPLAVPGLGANGDFPIDIQAQLVTRVDGKAAGMVDFQQTATGLLVRLGSIAELLGDRYEPAQLARIRASAAGNAYLPLAELQAQGIPISYDPVYDEFNVGLTDTRPKAARKTHMDQISAPERGLDSTAIQQVRR